MHQHVGHLAPAAGTQMYSQKQRKESVYFSNSSNTEINKGLNSAEKL